MKKIVIWESHSTLEGGQKVSLNILDALRDGYKCIFFVPEEGPLTNSLKQRGIDFKIIPTGSYSEGKKGIKDIAKLVYCFPKVFKEACTYLKENKIDLIYSNGSRTFIWSSMIGRLLSMPVIWHIHNFFDDRKTRFILSLLGQFNNVKKIVFVSAAVSEQFPRLKNKSEVIYNSLNISEFTGKNTCLDINYKFAIAPSSRIVSTISWISRPKNTEVLIRSIPYVLEQVKNVHFLIVGGVKEGHKAYYDYLLGLADERGIKDYVTFTGHCTDIANILGHININCVTSLEACPLVIPESYFAGVPVIAPDQGGTKELIKDRETGLIYRFNDEKDFANKISLLLKDEGLYHSMSENCRDYVQVFETGKFNTQVKMIVEQYS